jgi:predicted peroxiredoxin
MKARVSLVIAAVCGMAVVWGTGCANIECKTAAPCARQPAKTGVLVHVSSGPDQPHRVLMALKMAELMSEDHPVLVYFDVEGVRLVLKDSPDVTREGFASSHAQLEKLTDNLKVELCACPSCLAAAGQGPEDLLPGVELATKEAFFGFAPSRILTLDY